MNMKKISHEMNLQKWTQIVEECRISGKTAVKWCAENDINIKTYYYWQASWPCILPIHNPCSDVNKPCIIKNQDYLTR